MVDVYSAVLLVLELAVVFCCVIVAQKKAEYSKPLLNLYYAGMGCVLFYVLAVQSSNAAVGTFFIGLYYMAVDLVLLFMMRFILIYTNTQMQNKLVWGFIGLWATIDCISLLVNNTAHHMLYLEQAEYEGMLYWNVKHNSFYYFHLGIGYCMALFTIIVLVHRIVKSPKLYKKMYVSVLVVFGLVLVANGACYVMNWPIDASLLFYVLLALSFFYFLVYASPKGLTEGILTNVVEDIDNGIVCFDLRGKCIYANTKACELLEISKEQVGDLQDTFYVKRIRNYAHDTVDYECWDKEYSVEGENHHFHIEFRRLKGENDLTIGYFYKLTDKTAAMKEFQEEQYLATHDQLTGLYNRDYFFQKAEEILKRDPQKEWYMVCAQIVNFKLLNDLFGVEMSDKILVAQAALLKYTNYEDCIQGRVSDEQFAMLITKEHFNSEMTVKNLGRLQYMIDGRNYKLNIAMGVYNVADSSESPQSMFEKASMAVETHQQGDYQKSVVYYDTRILNQVLQERNVTEEFEEALENKQFHMFLQPQIDAEGKLVGAEALARWQHPQKGMVFPAEFLAVAEKSRLISLLDEYMWERAAEKLREWKDQGLTDATISVNISAKDFYYIDIYETLVKIVEKYHVDPSRMNLEISEMEILSDAEPQIKELNRLQEKGFRLRIDDFGRGYSSLNMLQMIKADSLKINLRLLGEIDDPYKSRRVLDAIIHMAMALDMDVIMESVETGEQVELLKGLGCRIFQGYYFSKPISVEEFEEKYLKVQ